MKWLFKRLAIVFLMMGVFCSAAIVVARLDHTPSKLQALGLDVCDGELCFRHMKLITDWTTVQKLFPQDKNGNLQLSYDGKMSITLRQSWDNIHFEIEITTDNPPLTINVEDIVAQYGDPCRVNLTYSDGYPDDRIIIYPMMSVMVGRPAKPSIVYSEHYWESPVLFVSIRPDNYWGKCDDSTSEYVGPWRGFLTAEEYHQRNLKDMMAAKLSSANP